jgi:hypothetical protein
MSTFSISDWYLLIVSLMASFRSIIYIFNLKYVTKVKILKKYWEEESIREIGYAYTGTIRMMMIFKSAIYWWAFLLLSNGYNKNILCYINILFDIQLLYPILYKFDSIKLIKYS